MGKTCGTGLLLVVLAGCSLTPGKSLTLFPEGHRLLDSAKELRQAQLEPLPLPRELDKRALPAYVVEPGDALLIQPLNLDSPVRIPADQPVLLDGTINLGRYGHLIVAGKTVEEIESMVRAAVEAKDKDAGPISVRLVTRVSKVFYVLGEVNAPGSFPLQGRETVLDAILAAGGLTDKASRRNIILSRPTAPHSCRIVIPICYRDIVQLGDTSTNYQIAPGDRIFVPSRTFCEEMFHSSKECPPCGQPQVPCNLGGDCGGSHDGTTPVMLGRPFAPQVLPVDTPAPPPAETSGK
jgi:protein involved in polysaccharide export with SLBB domain